MEAYCLGRPLAEGRFGEVIAATRKADGLCVALKRIRFRRLMPGLSEDPWQRSGEREVTVLSCIRHANVVALLDHFVSEAGSCAVLVYEYLSWDLCSLLARLRPMEMSHVKAAFGMLLIGVAYLHEVQVMHRDLKPSNVLLEGSSGCLKIADFGSARFLPGASRHIGGGPGSDLGPVVSDPSRCEELLAPLTRDVCSRWYKAPEMLFGSVDYTLGVDLWALGGILGELLSPAGKPLFAGQSDVHQLCCIFQVVGTPRERTWPEVLLLPDYEKVHFEPKEPGPLPFESDRPASSLQLLRQFLSLNPRERVTAAAALACDFFVLAPAAAEASTLVEGLAASGLGVGLEEGRDGSEGDSGEYEPVDLGLEAGSVGSWEGDGPPPEVWKFNSSDGLVPEDGTSAQPEVWRCDSGNGPAHEAAPACRRASTPPPPGAAGHHFKQR